MAPRGAVTSQGRVFSGGVAGDHLLQCTQVPDSFGNPGITFSLFQLDSSCEICGRSSIKQIIHSCIVWWCWVWKECADSPLAVSGAALQWQCLWLSLRSTGSGTGGSQQVLLLGLIAPRHRESSWTGDQTDVRCVAR